MQNAESRASQGPLYSYAALRDRDLEVVMISTKVDVSIVMPCLNEAPSISNCIANAQAALEILAREDHLRGEIVFADNSSTDGSQAIARELGARVVHCPKRGYGEALRCGINAAVGLLIVIGDSDGQHDFREAIPMIRKLQDGFDVCLGSRFRGQIMPHAMDWKSRYIGTPILTILFNLLYQSSISDIHCGLRAFTKASFIRMRPRAASFDFNVEFLTKATLLHLQLTEVPVTVYSRVQSRTSHLRPWQDGWADLRYLLMLNPWWVFLMPAGVFGVLGLFLSVLFTLLLPGQVGITEPPQIGLPWVLVGGALLAVGHQAALLGLGSLLAGIRNGYRRAGPRLRQVYRLVSLENMLLSGAAFLVVGFVIGAWVLERNIGARPVSGADIGGLVAALTCSVIGMQQMLGGFLFAVIAGNEADLTVALNRQDEVGGDHKSE